jgi:large subunit ribosomal protein L24
MKVKKGQKVKIIAGKYRGLEGLVLKAYPKRNLVEVEGVNVKKKTISKKKSESSTENFTYVQHPIHASNVKVIDETLVKTEVKNKEVKRKVKDQKKVEKK